MPEGLLTEGLAGGHRSETSPNGVVLLPEGLPSSLLPEGLLTEGIAALPPFEQTAVALRLQRDAAYMQLTATAVRPVTVFPYTLEAARATATVEAAHFAHKTTVEAANFAHHATAAAWHARSTVQAHAHAITATRKVGGTAELRVQNRKTLPSRPCPFSRSQVKS